MKRYLITANGTVPLGAGVEVIVEAPDTVTDEEMSDYIDEHISDLSTPWIDDEGVERSGSEIESMNIEDVVDIDEMMGGEFYKERPVDLTVLFNENGELVELEKGEVNDA